jgi:hypothetical protein
MNPRILVTPRSLTAERHPYVEEPSTRGFDVIYCTPGATPSEDELPALAPGCVGWLGVERRRSRPPRRSWSSVAMVKASIIFPSTFRRARASKS